MKSSKAFNTAVAAALVAAVALTACLMAFPQLLGGQSSAVAEAYEEMVFGTGGVLSVEISVKESDWETMLANATAEEYFACDVTVDGVTPFPRRESAARGIPAFLPCFPAIRSVTASRWNLITTIPRARCMALINSL